MLFRSMELVISPNISFFIILQFFLVVYCGFFRFFPSFSSFLQRYFHYLSSLLCKPCSPPPNSQNPFSNRYRIRAAFLRIPPQSLAKVFLILLCIFNQLINLLSHLQLRIHLQLWRLLLCLAGIAIHDQRKIHTHNI